MTRAALVAVRTASRAGRLASLDDVRAALAADAAEHPDAEPLAPEALTDAGLAAVLAAHPGVAAFAGRSGRPLYHAPDLLSRSYARILDSRGSPVALMAGEIRANSRDYPRPVPVELFEEQPFGLGREDIEAALRVMAASPEHQDIALVASPTGAEYLFSTLHLERGYAQFLAGQAESLASNP